jgi:hypothetical protein
MGAVGRYVGEEVMRAGLDTGYPLGLRPLGRLESNQLGHSVAKLLTAQQPVPRDGRFHQRRRIIRIT